MALRDRLEVIHEGFRKQAPEAAAAIHSILEQSRASGIADRIVREGERAPDFALEATDGRVVTLGELVGRGPVALSFYRGRW